MISSLGELKIKKSTPSELKNVKVKNKFSKFFIQVHLVYLPKNQDFLILTEKREKNGN